MTIVAHSHPFVIGVDTHAKTHTYAVVQTTSGQLLGTEEFPTTPQGIARAMSWSGRLTGGDAATLWAIEGIATYGARLARAAAESGYAVVEAPRMNAKTRHGVGKSDPLDARAIATAVLPVEEDRLCRPRADDGTRQALRVLVAARDQMASEKTMNINALIALLRANELGIDARKPLIMDQIGQVSRWHHRTEPLALATARHEAIRLAHRILDLHHALGENYARLTELITASPAAPLLEETGVGAYTAAVILTAWSHPGRVRNEAAFASLAGVNPIPASSGNTTRHRLNRGGDRRLNRALHFVAITRMSRDPATKAYVAKRVGEGRTRSEIRRCIKRYVARHLYRTLNVLYDDALGTVHASDSALAPTIG
ncbi:transposase [Microbacterium sp. Leaf288]|uniref:IS110 family transposase n=1 Tax=Microbacterium sp. Leaf288 TaxID=1736323 RepID=UPI0006F89F80|nr:IS110 family transposase [Microbacterium sp. Leaf288]KQP67805.1 transposase [Microbacterium sp. Leaf288]